MKTIRTILATLATVLLGFALVAWFSVRRNAAFIQRTIYQGFDQTFVVALVMGCAFLGRAALSPGEPVCGTEPDPQGGVRRVSPVSPGGAAAGAAAARRSPQAAAGGIFQAAGADGRAAGRDRP